MNTMHTKHCSKKEDGFYSILGDDRTLYNREDPDVMKYVHETVLEVMKAGGGQTKICIALSISTATYWRWKKVHPDFAATVAKGELLQVNFWDDLGLNNIDSKFFNEKLYTRLRVNQHYKYYSEFGRPKINKFTTCKTAAELGDALIECIGKGEISPDEALKISQTCCNMFSLKERTELEERLVELEKHQEKK